MELPSQIMENWATEPEVLRHYAINYTTGEVIPERLIKRIRESGKFNQGFIVTELVAAALTDMDIHAITEYEPFDVNEFEADAVYGRRGLIPQIQPRYRYSLFPAYFRWGLCVGILFLYLGAGPRQRRFPGLRTDRRRIRPCDRPEIPDAAFSGRFGGRYDPLPGFSRGRS